MRNEIIGRLTAKNPLPVDPHTSERKTSLHNRNWLFDKFSFCATFQGDFVIKKMNIFYLRFEIRTLHGHIWHWHWTLWHWFSHLGFWQIAHLSPKFLSFDLIWFTDCYIIRWPLSKMILNTFIPQINHFTKRRMFRLRKIDDLKITDVLGRILFNLWRVQRGIEKDGGLRNAHHGVRPQINVNTKSGVRSIRI